MMPQSLRFPLLIPAGRTIMEMYTDWGNLEIVSCVAWLCGAGPSGSTAYPREWARWGRPFSSLRQHSAPAGVENAPPGAQLGVAGKFR